MSWLESNKGYNNNGMGCEEDQLPILLLLKNWGLWITLSNAVFSFLSLTAVCMPEGQYNFKMLDICKVYHEMAESAYEDRPRVSTACHWISLIWLVLSGICLK